MYTCVCRERRHSSFRALFGLNSLHSGGPQKTKTRIAMRPSTPTPGRISRENRKFKMYMHPYVPSNTILLLSHKKQWDNAFAATLMGLEIIIKWNVKRIKIPYDIIYIWNQKYDTNLSMKQKQTHRQREQACGCQRRVALDWELGVSRCKVSHREWINKSLLQAQRPICDIPW